MTDANGDHLGDRLSALLDGELAGDEVRDADAHLAECEQCRHELTATASARSLVRGLPAVEPPFGFYERLTRRRRSAWRRGVGAVAGGAAAAAVLVVLATPPADRVGPPVGDLVERHAATASAGGDPVTEFVPVGVPVRFTP
jgi:anti-sigma factor RsiW